MDEKRISIRFRLDDDIDREIWNFLENQPKGNRQNTVKIALIHEIKGTNNLGEIKKLIQETIKDSLKNITITQESQSKQDENTIPTDVLSFISAL
jgi:hypothetical protein